MGIQTTKEKPGEGMTLKAPGHTSGPWSYDNRSGDAAAQIGAEEPGKGTLIRNGLEKTLRIEHPNADYQAINAMAYGKLSAICGMLTGTNRHAREWAKAEIRRLVKLGKGE